MKFTTTRNEWKDFDAKQTISTLLIVAVQMDSTDEYTNYDCDMSSKSETENEQLSREFTYEILTPEQILK